MKTITSILFRTLFLFAMISLIASYIVPARQALSQQAGETPTSGLESTPTLVTSSSCDPKSETVLYGDKDPKVFELQTYLTQLGYGDLLGKHGPKQVGIDGKFGSDTQRAVIKFQEDAHLKKIDGKVGPEMWAALCDAIAPKAEPAPPVIKANSKDNCDPAVSSKVVYPSKFYNKGIWSFIYGVYNGQGLVLQNLFAKNHKLLDTVSIPHFKMDYGGKSKIIRFCGEPASEPTITSNTNVWGKKYDSIEWNFAKDFSEPDLNGRLIISYEIVVRTDPITSCELTEKQCYRFIPLVNFDWIGVSPDGDPCTFRHIHLPFSTKPCMSEPTPEKLDKFTAFYKLDYGDSGGVVTFRDKNSVLGGAASFRVSVMPEETERFAHVVINGKQGQYDNTHSLSVGQEVRVPGCRQTDFDCLHMHWRWADMTPTIDPLVDTIQDGAFPIGPEGEPYFNKFQDVDIALVKYNPGEENILDPTTIVNGEVIGKDQFPDQGAGGRLERVILATSYHPILWYTASVQKVDQDQFFRHGMFVIDTSSPGVKK